jgi:hypothetical protein
MAGVVAQDLPAGTLIQGYEGAGAYTDCFVTCVPGEFSQAAYVEAFYTSWLFKLERLVLAVLVGKPSTDSEARALARGETDRFAAWSVEARTEDQILNRDYQSATRSWLMSRRDAGVTWLYFGTVVTSRSGGAPRGGVFKALLGFHRIYARALLRAAAGLLLRGAIAP